MTEKINIDWIINIKTLHSVTHIIHIYIYIYIYTLRCIIIVFECKVKLKLATIVEGDPKAPLSIATTPKCKEGYNFIS